MVANCDRSCPFTRRILIAASALAIGFSLSAAAQTATNSANSSTAESFSSSSNSELQALLNPDAFLPSGSPSAEPAPHALASPQYGGRNSAQYPGYESRWSHLAFEGGVGFTIPVGPGTSYNSAELAEGYLAPPESTGYNINVGGGWMFTKRVGALIEYTFDKQGMPGGYLTALSNVSGVASSGSALGGNINTWDFALEPIIYQPFSNKSGAYVTGGGGFYRKVTNFTEPVDECSFYGFCYGVPTTIDHFSSNQGGANFGIGFYRKVFGEDSNGRVFAEVRYVWVNSPKAEASNYYQGSGTEELIPVSFGVRF